MSAVARLQTGPLKSEAFYLTPNDSPNSHTRIAGLDFHYDLGKRGTLGFAYLKIYDSDIRQRDGLWLLDARFKLAPLASRPQLSFAGEYVYQKNGARLRAFGYYGELAYELSKELWKPLVAYRFAFFSGDGGDRSTSRNFDPLFYGMPEWGSWYQGEIFGEYVLWNQNLLTHRLRFRFQPAKAVTVNLLYYHFRLDDRPARVNARTQPRLAAIRSKHLGDEVDLTVDWVVRDWLTLSAVTAVAFPGAAAREFTGDDADWLSFMLLAVINF